MILKSRRLSVFSALGLSLLLTLVAATPVTAAATTKLLPIPVLDTQLESNWCWAAANQAVVQYVYGIAFPQCSQANAAGGRTDCCSNPSSGSCNLERKFPIIQTIDAAKGITTTLSGALSYTSVMGQINANRPFLVNLLIRGSYYHAEVVRGFSYLGGANPVQTVYLWDPFTEQTTGYDYAYVVNSAAFTWVNSLTYK